MGSIGAAIGWVTNVAAIRLLFKPYKPVRVFGLCSIQGLIPKRQQDIADALGKVVSDELITGEDVALSLTSEEIREKIAHKVRIHVQDRVINRLPFVIPRSMQESLADYAGKTLAKEVNDFLANPKDILSPDEIEDVRKEIKKIVVSKVLSFDMQKLEVLAYALARNELRRIEQLGGLLGFLIGLLQGLLAVKFYL